MLVSLLPGYHSQVMITMQPCCRGHDLADMMWCVDDDDDDGCRCLTACRWAWSWSSSILQATSWQLCILAAWSALPGSKIAHGKIEETGLCCRCMFHAPCSIPHDNVTIYGDLYKMPRPMPAVVIDSLLYLRHRCIGLLSNPWSTRQSYALRLGASCLLLTSHIFGGIT